jgi:hypothetical protein
MLIGNWSDMLSCSATTATTKQLTMANPMPIKTNVYHMIINGKLVRLSQLNKHVLECILPRFDDDHLPAALAKSHNAVMGRLEANRLHTHIYVYENERLYCKPLSFEIRFNSSFDRKFNLSSF